MAMVYYRYHIMVRENVSVLLQGKRLFQQYLVDVYCKIETERLQFLRHEQTTLQADCYQDLRDAILDGDGDPNNVGHRIILPSTFTGGPHYMHECQQDAMTYVRKHGHPDLFITATAIPFACRTVAVAKSIPSNISLKPNLVPIATHCTGGATLTIVDR